MVLCGRGVQVHQQGAADWFLCKAYGDRGVAGRTGSGAYGSRRAEAESLEMKT